MESCYPTFFIIILSKKILPRIISDRCKGWFVVQQIKSYAWSKCFNQLVLNLYWFSPIYLTNYWFVEIWIEAYSVLHLNQIFECQTTHGTVKHMRLDMGPDLVFLNFGNHGNHGNRGNHVFYLRFRALSAVIHVILVTIETQHHVFNFAIFY